MKTKRILIAEDEMINRIYLASILKKADYDVLESSCGSEAHDITLESDLDAIIADMGLPGMDGKGLVKSVRSGSNRNSKVPIIVATANSYHPDHEEIMKLGANDIIVKPFSEQELIELLEKYI